MAKEQPYKNIILQLTPCEENKLRKVWLKDLVMDDCRPKRKCCLVSESVEFSGRDIPMHCADGEYHTI